MNAHEAANYWNNREWHELTSVAKYEGTEAMMCYYNEAQIVISALLGALTPKQQTKQWPHIVARARRLIDASAAVGPLPEKTEV